MFGESTCAANLVAYPYPFGNHDLLANTHTRKTGDALFDVAALTRIAAERCATARCAITLMGAFLFVAL